MLKKSIGIGLLCLTGQAYASISVTTTQDIVADDQQCSLREAVTYINDYLTAQIGETEEQKKIRTEKAAKGYMGCGGESATAEIYLKQNQEYILNEEIFIKSNLSISTLEEAFNLDEHERGLFNATIKAKGNHRLFTIDDKRSEVSQIDVTFNQLNLQGCGSQTICEDRGGIIFNREALTLNYTKVTNGFANEGGAVYNEGIIAGSTTNSAGLLTITQSIFQNNGAKTGGVIFMGQPLFSIDRSIFRENYVTNTNGVLIYSDNAFDSSTTNTTSFTRTSPLVNSIFLKNKQGFLVNLRDGVYLNNVTAVDNQQGVYFHAPSGKAHVANSILAGNQQDCAYAVNDRSLALNNLVGSTCRAGEQGNLNTYLGTQKLFAGTTSESATCDRPPADGLLCPFTVPKDYFLGFFKPRLLTSYKTVNESPIVNRGRMYSDGSNQGLTLCEANGIRGLSRGANEHCDVGAFELVISPDNVGLVGQDILFGQKAKINILTSLGDGELLPASECQNVLGQSKAPDGSEWQVGCLRVEQSSVTPKSKGKVILDADGQLEYQPFSNWHGLDEFNLRVVTTTSRFSDAERDRDILIPARIVQSPPNNFPSETIDVPGTSGKFLGGAAGGSFGLSVLGLFALGLIRRKLK